MLNINYVKYTSIPQNQKIDNRKMYSLTVKFITLNVKLKIVMEEW